jgi:hypothetical protein
MVTVPQISRLLQKEYRMKKVVSTILTLLLIISAIPVIAEDIKIDADFPGGNIMVRGIDGDTIKLSQDLRDTAGSWFYWSFRIRGAEGRTLHFEIPGVIGARGPAVSHDGINWHWLSDKPDFSWDEFDYTFKPDEKEVYFSQCINYTEKNLKLFLEKYKDNLALKVESLCTTKKGRNVELLRISGNKQEPNFKILLASRHHCAETMATYALEGIIETALSDTEDGKWLREHCDFFIVPLVDKDGVEDGDQGKRRKPHDHGGDYIRKIYPEIQAITDQVPKWLDGKPLFVMDMHCPHLRGGDNPEAGKDKSTNEYFFFFGASPSIVRFGTILEKEKKGTIPYRVLNNLTRGNAAWYKEIKPVSTNNDALPVSSNDDAPPRPRTQSLAPWAAGQSPNGVFANTFELPFANAEGVVVDTDSSRELGNDLARAMRVYLETLE